VSILIATNDTLTISGFGYQTVTVVIYGADTTLTFLVPPTLGPNEVVTAALWDNTFGADLDWHMVGPGNRTQYPTDEGAVDWQYVDKALELPFATWHDYSSSLWGGEVIDIKQLNTSAEYDFFLFLWSRITGGDDSVTWANTDPSVFVFGGSATGLGAHAYYGLPPNPPTGFEYGFWSPFSFLPTGSGSLQVVDDLSPWDPAISESDIQSNAKLFYPCAYPTYCPYRLP